MQRARVIFERIGANSGLSNAATLSRRGRVVVAGAGACALGAGAVGAGIACSERFIHHNDSARAFEFNAKGSSLFEPDKSEVGPRDPAPESKEAKPTLSSQWNRVADHITDVVVPRWAHALPRLIQKLQNEISFAPGSLADEIWQETKEPSVHPEVAKEATVRISRELCDEEKEFLKKRKAQVAKGLAKYLGLKARDVNPDDVPIIAICGSGGGLRALVAGTSSYLSVQEAGLMDCITYTAGVSGSCWLQTLYYSSIGRQDYEHLIQHLKNRIDTHIAFPPPLLDLVTSAPTSKYLLAGPLEKLRGMSREDFRLVDIYGLMLGARLMVPKGELELDDKDMKLSNQRRYVDDGSQPLPIYTAVRHEIPEAADKKDPNKDVRDIAKDEAWFQWFEITPYEFWCDELMCGVPTWSLGRKFDKGRSVYGDNGLAMPELRVPLLMGIFGSAFCATLSHYWKEVRPVVKGIAGLGGVDDMLNQRNEDLVRVHPIEPADVPNFAMGLQEQLPKSVPESIHSEKNIQLMDAGMSNNLPIYPLLRDGRDVDMIIAFDASADIQQENWLRVVDGYARQRGIKGWPLGAGWPEPGKEEIDADEVEKGLEKADSMTVTEASKKLDQTQAGEESNAEAANKPRESGEKSTPLEYCNIWVGTIEERTSEDEPPASKRVEDDWQLKAPNAGIAVVYYPFVANPAVEGVDPQTSDFMSTWNFIYKPEQIDQVVALARQNFKEGSEKTRMAVRAVYERKKKQRLEREKKATSDRLNLWKGISQWG